MEQASRDPNNNIKLLKAIRSLRKNSPLRKQAELVLADPADE